MRDMAYFAKTQVMPAASIVPDSAFPANYAQKGMLMATLSLDASSGGLLELSGGAVSNMVPPTARAVLSCPLEAARAALSGAEGIEVSFADGRTEVVARGMAAHAARPWYGISAIHRLTRALAASDLVSGAALQTLRSIARLSGDMYGEASGIAREDAETGRTTQVVGLISLEGGRVRLSIDCRLSIATDLIKCRAAFKEYAAREGFAVESLTVKKPFYMPKDDPRIRALQAVYREVTGRDDAPYTTGGGTYSRELTNAVTFGPGFPDSPRPDFLPEGHGRAHEPDEAQSIPEIKTMLVLYAAALLALDGIADEGSEM
jgi:succinyl-diaminopimelate desuccinylase